MEQEWLYLHKHRNEIVAFVLGCLIYWIIYAGYIDRSSLRYDEVWLDNHDTIFLATGRWVGYLFRALLGHGPCYPIAGIIGGLLLNCAILIQQRLLGMKYLWQMIPFTTLYLCSLGWCDNLQYSTMTDFFAASVLFATLAVFFVCKGGRKSAVAAICALVVAFGCFQSSAICFLALLMLMLLRMAAADKLTAVFSLVARAMGVAVSAYALYYVGCIVARRFAPPDVAHIAFHYQLGLLGWRYVYYSVCQAAFPEACDRVLQYAVVVPLSCMFGMSGHIGQWLYASVWLPVVMIVARTVRFSGARFACAVAVFCAVLVYMPFLFSAVLLHEKGAAPYMCMAQPIVLCGLWSIGVLAYPELCRKIRTYLLAFLLVAFVKNAYAANVAARDDSYIYELARQEMRDMYLLAEIEEKNASEHPVSSYLVCGRLNKPSTKLKMGGELYPTSGMPYLLNGSHKIEMFSAFFRLPKMRPADKREEEAHAATLSQMPAWPASGSVKVDGDAVLIKIGEQGEPKAAHEQ